MKDKIIWKNNINAIIYIFPAMLIIGAFNIYPIFQLFDLSFQTEYNFFTGMVYHRGLGNYEAIVQDELFRKAVTNTICLVLLVVPIKLLLALMISLLLNRPLRLSNWYRSCYLLPLVTSVVASSMVWRLLFHYEYGLINEVFRLISIHPIGWLTEPEWSLPSVILFHVWKYTGYYVLFFVAGLQNIDREYFMAAKTDGASSLQRFSYITLPLLTPTIRFTLVVASIEAFKLFDEVFTLFGNKAGPLNSAITINYYIFQRFYGQSEYGHASAAACLLLIFMAVIAWLQIKFNSKRDPY